MWHRVALAAGVSAASATINVWISIGAGGFTIVLSGRQLWKLWQRRKQRRNDFPNLPPQPAPLPLTRVSRDEYMAAVRAWELYGAQVEQYFKDRKGQQ